VRFRIHRREEREDVALERVEPPLDHVDRGGADVRGAVREAAARRRRAQRDGHRRHRHL